MCTAMGYGPSPKWDCEKSLSELLEGVKNVVINFRHYDKDRDEETSSILIPKGDNKYLEIYLASDGWRYVGERSISPEIVSRNEGFAPDVFINDATNIIHAWRSLCNSHDALNIMLQQIPNKKFKCLKSFVYNID